MAEFLQTCVSGPNLPASILLVPVCLYWLLLMVGASDLDLLDFDLDVPEPSGLHSVVSLGLVSLRFLNLGNVPLMLWVSVFAIALWTLSLLLDDPAYHDNLALGAQAFARNAALAVVLTKLITQPLRGRFDAAEPNRVRDLMGQQCVVTTSEASPEFGQARFETHAAPLLLNVRTVQGVLAKGERAVIVDYDRRRNVYLIDKVEDPNVEP